MRRAHTADAAPTDFAAVEGHAVFVQIVQKCDLRSLGIEVSVISKGELPAAPLALSDWWQWQAAVSAGILVGAEIILAPTASQWGSVAT